MITEPTQTSLVPQLDAAVREDPETVRRRERAAAAYEIYKNIAAALEQVSMVSSKGWKIVVAQVKDRFPTFSVNGRDFGTYIDIGERQSHSSAWHRPRPVLGGNITVGDWGQRQAYPQRKDGSYSWGKIADHLATSIYTLLARDERYATTTANEETAERVLVKTKINRFSTPISIAASSDPERPVEVTIKLTRNLTEADAIRFVQALKEVTK